MQGFFCNFRQPFFSLGFAGLLAISSAGHAQPRPAAVTDEVVVTATRFADKYTDTPVNLTVITAEDIRNSAAKTLPDLLSEQAGITVHDFFGNNAATTTVDLRGFGVTGGQNTLILLDGRRIGDIDLSGVQWSAIPFAAIERIEIVRGGGAVLYGDGASAGVINIITRSPMNGEKSVTASLRAGSYGTRDGQLSGNLRGERAGISLTASNFESDGYRDNNRNRQTNALADLRWLTGGGEISLKAATDNQGLRLPGARMVQPSTGVNLLETNRRGAATPLDYSQRMGNQLTVDWRQQAGIAEFIIGAGYRDKKQNSYFDFGGFPDYREIDLNVWSFTPRVRIAQPLFGAANALVIGYDEYRWDYRLRKSNAPAAIGQPINRVNATQSNRAFYVQDTLHLGERTTLVAGWRRERFGINASDVFDATAPGGAFGSGASPGSQSTSVSAYEIGARYQLDPRLAATAKFARSFRFANVDETYETSPAFTAEFQFLRPQINRSSELGAEFRAARGNARATLFNIDVDDEVHLDPFTSGIGNTNLPPSRRRGIELDGRWNVLDSLRLSAAYTYTDARFREGTLPGGAFSVVIAGKRVPLVPQHKLNAAASWSISAKTRFNAIATWVGSQFMDNDEGNTLGVTIPSYALLDLKVVHEEGPWRLSAALNNLFDRQYYNYAVRSQFVLDRYNAYPLPGRNAAIALEYSYR
jgi:iron complex outermembrane receptor protein